MSPGEKRLCAADKMESVLISAEPLGDAQKAAAVGNLFIVVAPGGAEISARDLPPCIMAATIDVSGFRKRVTVGELVSEVSRIVHKHKLAGHATIVSSDALALLREEGNVARMETMLHTKVTVRDWMMLWSGMFPSMPSTGVPISWISGREWGPNMMATVFQPAMERFRQTTAPETDLSSPAVVFVCYPPLGQSAPDAVAFSLRYWLWIAAALVCLIFVAIFISRTSATYERLSQHVVAATAAANSGHARAQR